MGFQEELEGRVMLSPRTDALRVGFWKPSLKVCKRQHSLCRHNQGCFVSFLSDATVYVGGLDEKVSEPLLWELFLQAGPVVNTHMPKDRVTGQHQGKLALLLSSIEWGCCVV